MMQRDSFGQAYTTEDQLADLLYVRPDLDLSRFYVTDPGTYAAACSRHYLDWARPQHYHARDISVEEFDQNNQQHWHMPEEYRSLDIAAWVLEQCDSQAQLQRAGEELLLYQERELFDLLRYLKYLVDRMRQAGVVWGVGRGSSVASFVLYLIGVHRIDSLAHDLDPHEFLK